MLAVVDEARVRADGGHAAWSESFSEVYAQAAGAFGNAAVRRHGRAYLLGLLSHAERKNSWTLAEFAGDVSPEGMQRVLNVSPWDQDACRGAVCRYVARNLGDAGAVLVADETGFIKKGRMSAGVARVYTGTAGRVENCQVGVFLAYAAPDGSRALIDRELYRRSGPATGTGAGLRGSAMRRQAGQHMKTMSATIQIDAPPQAVWAVLTDLGRYPEWNPLFREASGQVAVGNRITLRSVHPANGRLMTVKPKITVADPDAELRWVSSLPGIISGEHRFALTPADGGTRLEQSETFRGLLTAFLGKTFAQAEASFRALNEALKNRAEGS